MTFEKIKLAEVYPLFLPSHRWDKLFEKKIPDKTERKPIYKFIWYAHTYKLGGNNGRSDTEQV